MSEDEKRITAKDAKDLLETQKSLMLEQKIKFEQDTKENREEYVEMKFNVPLSLTGKLAEHYAKLYKKWMDED